MRKPKVIDLSFYALYTLFVFAPFLALCASSVSTSYRSDIEWMQLLLPTGRQLTLLTNSVLLAAFVSTLSGFLGWVGAVFLWDINARARVNLIWLVLLAIALPPYIYSLGWLSINSSINQILQNLGMGLIRLHGWSATVLVETAAYLPLALAFAWFGLRGIDLELFEAGRLLKGDFYTLIRVLLPLSFPALIVGIGVTFLLSLLDYSIPSLFQISVYPLDIFADFSATNQPERAFLLSVPLMILSAGILVVIQRPLKKLNIRKVTHRSPRLNPINWPYWFSGLQAAVGIFILAICIAPLIALSMNANSEKEFVTTLARSQEVISYSLFVAIIAAIFCLPVAYMAANYLLKTGKNHLFSWSLVLLPVAIPSPLVGIGWITILNNYSYFSQSDYLAPIIVCLSRFVPLAVLVLVAQMRRSDPLLNDAAKIFQPSQLRRWTQVAVPLATPGLLATVGLVFVLSLSELGATLMVLPPGRETLTLRIYNYLHYGATGSVVLLAFVLAAFELAVAGLAVASLRISVSTAKNTD